MLGFLYNLFFQPELLELMLRQLRYILHENHYLITDCKRRLIDMYGHVPGLEYDKLSKEVLSDGLMKKILIKAILKGLPFRMEDMLLLCLPQSMKWG